MTNRPTFSRLPKHVGLIPDGNRRWARQRGLHPAMGYAAGMEKGLVMLDELVDSGIEEVSVYGFTMDNTKRPKDQRIGFSDAVKTFIDEAMSRDIALKVIGDHTSEVFPKDLKQFALNRQGNGHLKVNMLVNYGWNWDLQHAICQGRDNPRKPITELLASSDVSRIDMVVRWGGMRRL
ncbi:MAG: undecaprenyl diphosphate synthase family protein, partial [Chlorobia bacterium]|nr:undecaprenyl diphosphate synthase family protein [Fimbriimonadaceae bacterium]